MKNINTSSKASPRTPTEKELSLYLRLGSITDHYTYWEEIIKNNVWLVPKGVGYVWYDLETVKKSILNTFRGFFFPYRREDDNQRLLDLIDHVIQLGSIPASIDHEVKNRTSTGDSFQLELL